MRRILAVSLILSGGLFACSSSSTSSGVDRNKRLADLTAAETAQLCDDTATSIGGYGKEKTVTCNGTTLTMKAPASQAECVSNSKVPKTCAATVGQVEDCRDHEMACSQDQSSCAALVECATTTDGG